MQVITGGVAVRLIHGLKGGQVSGKRRGGGVRGWGGRVGQGGGGGERRGRGHCAWSGQGKIRLCCVRTIEVL